MRIARWAEILNTKYGLTALAGPNEDRLDQLRDEILNTYYTYIDEDSATPAYNIIPLLAVQGDPHMKQIVALFDDLASVADVADVNTLFDKVQAIVAILKHLGEGEKKKVRENVDDIIQVRRKPDKNRREQAKGKFEKVAERLNRMMKNILDALNVLKKKMGGSESPVYSGDFVAQVKEPSEQDKFMFRMTPLARANGLGDQAVFSEVEKDDDLKRPLWRLVNRGKNRWAQIQNNKQIIAEVQRIMELWRQKQTNQPYFEAGEEEAKEMARPKWFTPTPEQKREREEQLKNAPTPMSDAEYMKMHQEKALQQRLEDAKKYQQQTNPLNIQNQEDEAQRLKEIEEDRERLIRSEGKIDILLARFAKRYL